MATDLPLVMEFHISRLARDRYQFDQNLFGLSGQVVFANFHAARTFAQQINQKRDLVNYPEQAVRAGQINALGMIDEIFHYVFQLYAEQANPKVREELIAWIEKRLGKDNLDKALAQFIDEFPPTAVYRREISPQDYLQSSSEGIPHRETLLEELAMLWLTNQNPATDPYHELFDASSLEKNSAYPVILRSIQEFFALQPGFGPEGQRLLDMLRSPALAVPYSLSGQLEYIRERWGALLGRFIYRLLGSLDLLKEEEKIHFAGPGPIPVPNYRLGGLEGGDEERFSADQAWMPTLVMIAKNTFVWLDQLSRQYQRPIQTLDQIPEEELDRLAGYGISGLWLIGLWERSQASARIKQMCGNPDAVASAYSLSRYDIAADLGGPAAYAALRDKAWRRGIRLASDMVPNHMGIDSSWVVEHPDWFISLDYSPFPAYSFNGADLSNDGRVGIYLEDHYFDRSDAAVVFKRVDRFSGKETYIYHGNDGTSMPWNDTAQLNYLNPQVREAVIQTILHVARQFPIIRFDAAMTLAKKHYQRLWFPEPGSGGAIPSRAEFGLTRPDFDQAFPQEFWREVVDRVAQEAPDTLLLAEAFWLMESYFVRTLGMHRVYNSAFMNLLRNEENAKYREILKNTLEFDPEILKRFVNFMNNPDERTAADQFGKGDKYFGICTLMVTFPGLPMIGHGQFEGYTEKYGMEFRRALWDETPDGALVQRHEREIVPLLRRRRVFAGVDHFLLYDFFTPEGPVNEDVYCFSNRDGMDRGLVVYLNKFGSTRGWIRMSAAYAVKSGASAERRITQTTLGEGLGLTNQERYYTILRDITTGLEYIRRSQELCDKGLYLELNAYQCHAFVDIREVQDDEAGRYGRLEEFLNGGGVPRIEDALQEVFLQPILNPFNQLVNPGMLEWLMRSRASLAHPEVKLNLLNEVEGKLGALHTAIARHCGEPDPGRVRAVTQMTLNELQTVLQLPILETRYPLPSTRKYQAAVQYLKHRLSDDPLLWITLLGWVFTHNLGKLSDPNDRGEISRTWIDEYLLGRSLSAACRQMGIGEEDAGQLVHRIKLLTNFPVWFPPNTRLAPMQIVEYWLSQTDFAAYLGVNRFQGVLWFNQEAFEQLLWWTMCLAVIQIAGDASLSATDLVEAVISTYATINHLRQAENLSAYRVDGLIAALKKENPPEE